MNGQFSHTDYDVCIVGAGIAGTVMAILLGRQGKKVLIVEKTFSDQDRIVGELLQPGGVALLEKMGLGDALNEVEAQTIVGYGIFFGEERFHLPYLSNEEHITNGRGFRYEKLLEALRNTASKMDTVTVKEGIVTSICENPSHSLVTGIRYIQKESGVEISVSAPLTIMSDGCFSSFRKGYVYSKPELNGFFIGLVLEGCKLPFPNYGHVILAEKSPFLAYPVGRGQIRMLIDYPFLKAPRPGKALDEYLTTEIGPQVPKELRAGYFKALEEGQFKVMPNQLLASAPKPEKGIAILGDALNMRHPLTGGGMTVALNDVDMLAKKLSSVASFTNFESVAAKIHEHYAERTSRTATINILADALYQVFSHPELKVACFDYLKRGKNYFGGPISLLSGISTDRNLLLRHFFAVAQFGAMQAMKQDIFPDNVRKAYRMIQTASNIITPLLDNENPGMVVRTVLKGSKFIFPEPKEQAQVHS